MFLTYNNCHHHCQIIGCQPDRIWKIAFSSDHESLNNLTSKILIELITFGTYSQLFSLATVTVVSTEQGKLYMSWVCFYYKVSKIQLEIGAREFRATLCVQRCSILSNAFSKLNFYVSLFERLRQSLSRRFFVIILSEGSDVLRWPFTIFRLWFDLSIKNNDRNGIGLQTEI